jgi:hypothetical protein
METQATDRLSLAAQFVSSTNSPIFLTGKAGTGKTTFLKTLHAQTHKPHVIVAPTGIAALNANGVTIHSQFLLPFGSFIPSQEPEGTYTQEGSYFTKHTLLKRHPLNSARTKVLKQIELLIIDEVSMLRADILDAIDFRLKQARRNHNEPFGGVQLLFIGDLFQLPPIVRREEQHVMLKFYKSLHFFEAQSLKTTNLVYLELDKIFRQRDPKFISLLNTLRMNEIRQDDIRFLNSFYQTEEELSKVKDAITITTHNSKAEEQNQKALVALPCQSFFFKAEVNGEFPESLFPIPLQIELKEGAQIMFIKNDSSGFGAYYNGKLAIVKEISTESITVVMEASKTVFTLRKERWENKKYKVNEESKEIDEDVIGTFDHYPIKLAWAVTVHKSQGLTFEKAIIDVGKAFSPGQVYVALSRLTGIEGLLLKSKLSYEAFRYDTDAIQFTKATESQPPLEKLLPSLRQEYLGTLFNRIFDFRDLIESIQEFLQNGNHVLEFDDPETQAELSNIASELFSEIEFAQKFQRQLNQLMIQGNESYLQERIQKGCKYYTDLLIKAMKSLFFHMAKVEQLNHSQTYLEGLSDVETAFFNKMTSMQKIELLVLDPSQATSKVSAEEIAKNNSLLRFKLVQESKIWYRESYTPPKDSAKNKVNKDPNKQLVFDLAINGRTLEEISDVTGFSTATVEKQLGKAIALGKISVEKLVDQETISECREIIEQGTGSLKEILKEVSKSQRRAIRFVWASMFNSLEEKPE